jgi:tRNA G18 (ribose-2'-O)-methylase SpoU
VVAKIASGALEHVKIVVVQNLNNAVSKMKENGFWIIGSSLDGSEEFTDIDPKLNYGVIVGNEGVGISYQLKQNCDFMVKIPMIGQVNSLNVSVAAALLMYKLKKLY